MVYGKNFAAIAEFLDRKSVKDCVLYYYLTKKRQNYKAFMGKKRKKTPKCYKPPLMPRVEEVAQKAPQDANDITSKLKLLFFTSGLHSSGSVRLLFFERGWCWTSRRILINNAKIVDSLNSSNLFSFLNSTYYNYFTDNGLSFTARQQKSQAVVSVGQSGS